MTKKNSTTKIIIHDDCGNSPKAQFIKEFNKAFAQPDKEFILGCFAEDATWRMVGGTSWTGKESLAKAIDSMGDESATELEINTIISHGKYCAASGSISYANGTKIEFCDMYEFSSHAKDAKIQFLTGYAIESQSAN